MNESIKKRMLLTLSEIHENGRFKYEHSIKSAQQAAVVVNKNQEVLNFCANNYLGLANDPSVIEAAKKTLDERGFGMASVRFICGTQDIHRQLEERLAAFLGTEDCILYAAAFDANGGLFEPLFDAEDAIISDSLNHASIIDGIRLCKAQRFRYYHNDMEDLERQLKAAQGCRSKIIVTDGVFSMDGTLAQLDIISQLAKTYDALVMTDECHATGIVGPNGRGTHEEKKVMSQIDLMTGTLGKALGGASGGFTCGPKEIIDVLRQTSRPYLFSNTLAPPIVGASLAVLDLLESSQKPLNRLKENTRLFRSKMTHAGFDIKKGNHPIVPIMLYDDHLAKEMAHQLLTQGIYVVGFSFPVVPKGQARIRVQLSACHTKKQIETLVRCFCKVGKKLGVISS